LHPRKNPYELCPANGFGEKGDEALAVCGCPDFYRIITYDGVYAENLVRNDDGSSLNRTDVIYEVWGYIEGGNHQIHRPTGKDLR